MHGPQPARPPRRPGRAAFEATVDAVSYGEGLVWRASRGEARVLLVGTMHLSDPRHVPLAEALAPALRGSDLLLLETTPEGEARAARAMADQPELTLAPGPTLPERLAPDRMGGHRRGGARPRPASLRRRPPAPLAPAYHPLDAALPDGPRGARDRGQPRPAAAARGAGPWRPRRGAGALGHPLPPRRRHGRVGAARRAARPPRRLRHRRGDDGRDARRLLRPAARRRGGDREAGRPPLGPARRSRGGRGGDGRGAPR